MLEVDTKEETVFNAEAQESILADEIGELLELDDSLISISKWRCMQAIQIAIVEKDSYSVDRLESLVLEVATLEYLLVDYMRHLLDLRFEHGFGLELMYTWFAQPIGTE